MNRAIGIGFRFIGIAIGAASFLSLASKGFDISIGPLVVSILTAYEESFSWVLVLIEPAIKEALRAIGAFFGIAFQLDPDWKHVFALSWLYVFATAKNAFSGGWTGARITAVLRFVVGGALSLLFGVAAGASSVEGATNTLQLVLSPIVGLLLYRLFFALLFATERSREGRNWLEEFVAKTDVPVGVVGIGAVILLLAANAGTTPFLRDLSDPGLALLCVFVVALGLLHAALGARQATRLQKPGETWRQTFLKQGNTNLARLMLATIATAIGALIVDWILAIFGL